MYSAILLRSLTIRFSSGSCWIKTSKIVFCNKNNNYHVLFAIALHFCDHAQRFGEVTQKRQRKKKADKRNSLSQNKQRRIWQLTNKLAPYPVVVKFITYFTQGCTSWLWYKKKQYCEHSYFKEGCLRDQRLHCWKVYLIELLESLIRLQYALSFMFIPERRKLRGGAPAYWILNKNRDK